MKGIADTGFVVAFANRKDRYHKWAVGVASQVTEPLLTCEAVLAEVAFQLGDATLVIELVQTGLIRPDFRFADHLQRIAELAFRYRDRQPDLADLCIIRMSELHRRHSVITVDVSDFRVYRRNRREVIPLILPPGL